MAMQAIHQPLIPETGIRHSLFLEHFTPSTIYPYPQPAWVRRYGLSSSDDPDGPRIKITGNLIVAGGSELRVFEVREEPVLLGEQNGQDAGEQLREQNERIQDDQQMDADMGDDEGFRNMATSGVTEKAQGDRTRLQLHLVYQTTLHGSVTGLAGIRTMSSLEDGLDRLLISFRDAKLALLEWSRGEVATVSLHTYERCPQVMYGDVDAHRPLLRTDPNDKLAALSLPSNALAMLPIVQDLMDTEAAEAAYGKDVPYMPSFVLPLEEMSTSLCNVKDFLFLPGFNNPTIAFLYEPKPTWTGRLQSHKDTYHVEIRTLDVLSKTYASLSSISGLPSDCQYMLACATSIGGVIVVTSTAIIHVDQSGRRVATSVNGWYDMITTLPADRSEEERRVELDGSGAVWMDDKNLLLSLRDGNTMQIRLELEGRAVHKLSLLGHNVGNITSLADIIKIGSRGVFVASAVGDSELYQIELEQYKVEAAEQLDSKSENDLDMDLDEDLYGESTVKQDINGARPEETATRALLRRDHALPGFGYVVDACLGMDRSEANEVIPELTMLHGGDSISRVDLCRPGLGLKRRRKLADTIECAGLWCVRSPGIRPYAPTGAAFQTSGLFLSAEADSTELLALQSEENGFELVKKFSGTTVAAGPMFGGTSFIRVSSQNMTLVSQDGEVQQTHCEIEDGDLLNSASIMEPYVAVRTNAGRVSVFHGEASTMELKQLYRPPDGESLEDALAVCIISDESGVFRTFDPSTGKQTEPKSAKSQMTNAKSGNRMQLTSEQLARLQEAKPSISTTIENDLEATVGINRGSHWLCAVTKTGRLEIRTLPELGLVFASDGILDASMALLDDAFDKEDAPMHAMGTNNEEADEEDLVQGIAFATLGRNGTKPHLMVMHNNDQLAIYEATPRFTLENLGTDMSRRSLAVRFRKVLTKVVSRGRLPRQLIPLSMPDLSGVFVTGSSPFWILADTTTSVKTLPHGAPVRHLCDLAPGGPALRASFLVADAEGLHALILPGSLDIKPPLTTERVQTERSYTHLVHDVRSSCYVGASALTVPYQLYSDECIVIEDPDAPNLTPPTIERSTLELFDPHTWAVVDGHEFEENEIVLCVESMLLGDRTRNDKFLVVGTSVNRGEDMSGRGKTYVFEVVQVVAADDRPDRADWGLRLICEEEAKEPVTAIAGMGSYLIAAEGQKTFVKAFEREERLVPVAFLDVNVYATSIKTLKNLVLIGDMVKSVWFCVFQESPYKLDVIARDFQDASIVSVDFLSAEGKTSFVATDTSGNMRVLEWDPEQAGSVEGGDRLLRRTEYHCGAVITKTLTVARRRPNEDKSATQSQIALANEFGGLSTLIPSKAARFKRLQLLQGQLTRSVQHVAGLNPKAYRNVYNPLVPRQPTKTILDGQLLSTYVNLPISRQRELAEPIGTNRETVLNDLVDLSGFGAFF